MAHGQKGAVYLPLTDILSLKFHLHDTRPGLTPDDFVTELVQRWLTIETERYTLRETGQPVHGFQWKDVFLPEGTRLRTCYRHTAEYAEVVGEHIRSSEGKPLTPSQFVNQHAIGRNAWHLVWIRFPGEELWIRADQCRQNRNARPKRKAAVSPHSLPNGDPGHQTF
ncbi:hypothetical protein [Duganella callida]|uniref:Uncharacterized protein n=1 Tax=Duganella callida TaxID=2561932 RepID=A0A4Y9SB77_9BURK|nr:hypothetical protein [Duganella callida]TFW17470.1 hypothetical protein E4L98_20600 [Duganella callida]